MRKLKLVITLAIILALAACNKAEGSVPSPSPPVQSPAESSDQGVRYSHLTLEDIKNDRSLPENITDSISGLRAYRGFSYFKAGDGYIVFIGMGQKPTGGYGVEVKIVEDIEGLIRITVEEQIPREGDIVTQVLTYPYALLKIDVSADNFEAVTTADEKLSFIELKTASGKYRGRTDDDHIEITLSGFPDDYSSGIFRLSEELKEVFEELMLNKNDEIELTYIEAAGAQPVIIDLRPTGAGMMQVAVYYLKSNDSEIYLVREVHTVKKSEGVARAALNELIKADPVTPGAYRVLPAETEILGISIEDGLATVDFSGDVLNVNIGAAGEALGISSIVNSLTEFPTVQRVKFTVDGRADKAMDWWGHVGLYDQPFERELNSVYEPAIWVTAPTAGQKITGSVTIAGSARVFEASVSFRLKDAAGNVLAQGFTTASAGAPDRGDFTSELSFDVEEAGRGQLEVFEVSMEDGSDRNLVVIPVELG